jgi:hypothetical protein
VGPLSDAFSRFQGDTGGFGAVLSAASPIVGGFASIVSAFQNAADTQYEAAVRMMEAAEQFKNESASFREGAYGTGVTREILSLQQAYQKLSNANSALHPVTTFGNGQYSIEDAAGFYKERDALDAALKTQIDRITSDFWRSITRAENELAGPAGAYRNAVDEIERAYAESRKTVEALKGGQEELNRVEALRIQQLAALRNELEKAASAPLLSRYQSLTGASSPYQSGSVTLAPESEYLRPLFDKFNNYLDGLQKIKDAAESSAFFDQIQASIAQQQLQVSQESLRVSEASVGELQQTLDSLRRASSSLALGSNSPLNARQRYHVAENDLESQFQIALGGGASGQKAAQGLGSYIDSFLGVSKERFASGTPYSSDYNRAQSMLDALEGIYGPQLTTEEKTLAELKKHTDLLTKQLDTSKNSLVEQLVTRANTTTDSNEIMRIIATLKGLGYQLGRDVTTLPNGMSNPTGAYYPLSGYVPPQGTPSYQPAWDAYVAAHGGNPDLTTSEWVAAGMPSYARGTSWHRGGMALVGERGPELLNLPRGSSVTNNEQFSAPIVAALRPIEERLARIEARLGDAAGELWRASYAKTE